jgi:hypothetical protein
MRTGRNEGDVALDIGEGQCRIRVQEEKCDDVGR